MQGRKATGPDLMVFIRRIAGLPVLRRSACAVSRPFTVRNTEMKQTKPYGRAFPPPESGKPTRPKNPAEDRRMQAAEPDQAITERGPLVFNRPSVKIQPPKQRSTLATVAIKTALLIAATLAYVILRDSVFIQNLITMVTNKESVMTCLSGEMQYVDWSVWDRLVGNGRFVCTEWKVQARFVSFPRF